MAAAEALGALLVEDEARVLGPVTPLDPLDDVLGAGHLRHAVRPHEADGLHAPETRFGEPVDEVGTDGGLQNLALVLEPVARADVAENQRPVVSTRSGRITTVMRSSSGLRHGYSSWPRYFFASLSIWSSAPSVVSSAVPLTETHR